MVDFNTLLDQKADDFEAPKPLPAGEYTFIVDNYEFGESSVQKTPYVRYFLRPTEAGEDVDEDLLAEVNNWQQKRLRMTFYLTENAGFMLRNFLEEACQIDIAGKTLKEIIPEAKGCEIIGTVSVQEGENSSFNPDVKNPQPAE